MRDLIKQQEYFLLKLSILSTLIVSLVMNPVAFAAQTPNLKVFPSTISIPKNLGEVEELWLGTSPQTMIYIQDAHDSLEAQENISRLIHRLVEKQGVKTVYEEGYEGPVPTDSFFGFIQNPRIRKMVSYFFLDRLRIGGAEYAHINRKKPFQLVGADNMKLHLKNIEQYREAAKSKSEIQTDLNEITQMLSLLIHQSFPKEMKDWIKLKERYEQNSLPLLDYLNRSVALIDNVSEFPSISLLLAAEKTNHKIFIEQVKARDVKALYEEVQALESTISKRYLKNLTEQKTFEYYVTVLLLKRLGEIEITSSEFEAIRMSLKSFNTADFASFMAAELKRPILLSKRWEYFIRKAIKFYEIANARNVSVAKSLEELSRRPEEKVSVLVYGGFHKKEIRDLLREKGISYLIVSPRISRFDARHQGYYKKLMTDGHHDFEISFAVKMAARPNADALGPKTGLGVSRSQARPQTILSMGSTGRNEIRAGYASVLNLRGQSHIWLDQVEQGMLSPKTARSEARVDANESPRILSAIKSAFKERLSAAEANQIAGVDADNEMADRIEPYIPIWQNTGYERAVLEQLVRESLEVQYGDSGFPVKLVEVVNVLEKDVVFPIVNGVQPRSEVRGRKDANGHWLSIPEKSKIVGEINQYVLLTQEQFKQKPWLFYQGGPQSYPLVSQIKLKFIEMISILDYQNKLIDRRVIKDPVKAEQVRYAAKILFLFSKVLNQLKSKKSKLRRAGEPEALEFGKGNSHTFYHEIGGRLYKVIVIARHDGKNGHQARIGINLVDPSEAVKADHAKRRFDETIDSLRVDFVPLQKKGKPVYQVQLDLPQSFREFVTDKSKQHFLLSSEFTPELFSEVVQAVDKKVALVALPRGKARQKNKPAVEAQAPGLGEEIPGVSKPENSRSEIRSSSGNQENDVKPDVPKTFPVRIYPRELDGIDDFTLASELYPLTWKLNDVQWLEIFDLNPFHPISVFAFGLEMIVLGPAGAFFPNMALTGFLTSIIPKRWISKKIARLMEIRSIENLRNRFYQNTITPENSRKDKEKIIEILWRYLVSDHNPFVREEALRVLEGIARRQMRSVELALEHYRTARSEVRAEKNYSERLQEALRLAAGKWDGLKGDLEKIGSRYAQYAAHYPQTLIQEKLQELEAAITDMFSAGFSTEKWTKGHAALRAMDADLETAVVTAEAELVNQSMNSSMAQRHLLAMNRGGTKSVRGRDIDASKIPQYPMARNRLNQISLHLNTAYFFHQLAVKGGGDFEYEAILGIINKHGGKKKDKWAVSELKDKLREALKIQKNKTLTHGAKKLEIPEDVLSRFLQEQETALYPQLAADHLASETDRKRFIEIETAINQVEKQNGSLPELLEEITEILDRTNLRRAEGDFDLRRRAYEFLNDFRDLFSSYPDLFEKNKGHLGKAALYGKAKGYSYYAYDKPRNMEASRKHAAEGYPSVFELLGKETGKDAEAFYGLGARGRNTAGLTILTDDPVFTGSFFESERLPTLYRIELPFKVNRSTIRLIEAGRAVPFKDAQIWMKPEKVVLSSATDQKSVIDIFMPSGTSGEIFDYLKSLGPEFKSYQLEIYGLGGLTKDELKLTAEKFKRIEDDAFERLIQARERLLTRAQMIEKNDPLTAIRRYFEELMSFDLAVSAHAKEKIVRVLKLHAGSSQVAEEVMRVFSYPDAEKIMQFLFGVLPKLAADHPEMMPELIDHLPSAKMGFTEEDVRAFSWSWVKNQNPVLIRSILQGIAAMRAQNAKSEIRADDKREEVTPSEANKIFNSIAQEAIKEVRQSRDEIGPSSDDELVNRFLSLLKTRNTAYSPDELMAALIQDYGNADLKEFSYSENVHLRLLALAAKKARSISATSKKLKTNSEQHFRVSRRLALQTGGAAIFAGVAMSGPGAAAAKPIAETIVTQPDALSIVKSLMPQILSGFGEEIESISGRFIYRHDANALLNYGGANTSPAKKGIYDHIQALARNRVTRQIPNWAKQNAEGLAKVLQEYHSLAGIEYPQGERDWPDFQRALAQNDAVTDFLEAKLNGPLKRALEWLIKLPDETAEALSRELMGRNNQQRSFERIKRDVSRELTEVNQQLTRVENIDRKLWRAEGYYGLISSVERELLNSARDLEERKESLQKTLKTLKSWEENFSSENFTISALLFPKAALSDIIRSEVRHQDDESFPRIYVKKYQTRAEWVDLLRRLGAHLGEGEEPTALNFEIKSRRTITAREIRGALSRYGISYEEVGMVRLQRAKSREKWIELLKSLVAKLGEGERATVSNVAAKSEGALTSLAIHGALYSKKISYEEVGMVRGKAGRHPKKPNSDDGVTLQGDPDASRSEVRLAGKLLESKRVLIDFKDLAANFTDEQIKEVAYMAKRSKGRDSQVLIYNLDPSDALGKFFRSLRLSNLKTDERDLGIAAQKLQGFKGEIIHLSSQNFSIAREKVAGILLKSGIQDSAVYSLRYNDAQSGVLGAAMKDFERGLLKKQLPDHFAYDPQGNIYLLDASLASAWQQIYDRSLVFARSA